MKFKNLLLFVGLMTCMSLRTWATDTEPDNNAPGGANTTTEGASVSGSIDNTSDDQDWYIFTTDGDGTINLSLDFDGYYVYLNLFDSDGATSLGGASGFGGGAPLVVNVSGLSAGTYYARILRYSTSPGNYTLTTSLTDEADANDAEPNDDYLTALTLAENDSSQGHINFRYNGGGRDTYDWYQVNTSNDGSLSATMVLDGFYGYVQIYDNDGSTALSSEAAGYAGSAITVSAPGVAQGTYYIRVRGYGTSESGYTLKNILTTDVYSNDAENNDSYSTANILAENDSTVGHINFRYNGGGRDTYDWYQVNTSNDGSLSATMVLNGFYGYVQIYDNDGSTALSSEAAGYAGSAITVNAPGVAQGTYYIRVRGYGTSESGYTLKNILTTDVYSNDAENNDSYSTANILAENDSTVGHINFRYNGGGRDTYDWYQVNTSNDGSLSATMVLNGYFGYIQIYDNDGSTALTSEVGNYGGAVNTVTAVGVAQGTYYIRIRGYGTSESGYTLKNELITDVYANDAEVNDTYSAAVAMMTNDSAQAHINYRYNGGSRDTYDWYAITLHNSGNLSAVLTSNTYYKYIQLYNTDGTSSLTSEVGGYAGSTLTVSKTGLAPGTYYVRVRGYADYAGGYTLTNNYCPDAITITAEGETTFCAGESVILSTEDHHLSYSWSDGSTTATNAVTLTGDYYLTIDNGGGCVRTSNTINAESTPLPVAVISPDGPTEFCTGGSVTLSVPSGPDSYVWSNGATTPTITVSATGDYYVQLYKNSCTAISDPIHITVNTNPVPVITPDGPTTFCDGGSVTLNTGVYADYSWSDGSTASSLTADASGDYYVTVTDANGCSGTSATTTVTENPIPVAGISADGPVEFCTGGSVNLMATGVGSYAWSTGATSSSINVTSSGDYYVTVTNSGCSDVSETITVTVSACGSVSISADGPVTFCEGGSVVLTSTEADGNIWSTGETTQSITVSESGDYYAMNGANTSNTISVNVNANPEPVISADGPTSFCSGSVNLSADMAYASYDWSNASTEASINVSEAGDYYLTVTDGNGCEGTSNTISVSTGTSPEITISIDGSNTICYGGSLEITAVSTSGNLQWYRDGGMLAGETDATILASLPGMYTCVATDGTCSTTSNTIRAKAAKKLALSPAGPYTICPGGSIVLSLPSVSGATYQWYKGANPISGATGHNYTVTAAGNYQCMVMRDGCTRISDKANVTIACREGAELSAELMIYPNPAAEDFTVSYNAPAAEMITVSVADITGKILIQQIIAADAGNNAIYMSSENIPSGMYILSVTDEKGSSSVEKLVIEK